MGLVLSVRLQGFVLIYANNLEITMELTSELAKWLQLNSQLLISSPHIMGVTHGHYIFRV
jgi:hypothetical protein